MRKISLIIIQIFVVYSLLSGSLVYADTIKAGVIESTPVPIVAEWPVDSNTQVGEHFSVRVVGDMTRSDGTILIPKNSRVVGVITDVTPARSFHRDSKVDIKFEKIIFPDNVQTLNIDADGLLVPDRSKTVKLIGGAVKNIATGSIFGAITGFKFGGIIGTGSSTAANLAIGAAAGAGISLISFMAKNGEDVKINPGLPMILNMTSIEEQEYAAQQIQQPEPDVKAEIIEVNENTIKFKVQNNLRKNLPLTNLKIVDGLGYTASPTTPFTYHDMKYIPALSTIEYKFQYRETIKDGRYWLVLTDSFGKQEFFREELPKKKFNFKLWN